MFLRLSLLLSAIFIPATTQGSRPVGAPIAMACAPSDGDIAAVLVVDAVWITHDRGRSWTHLYRFASPRAPYEEKSVRSSPAEDPDSTVDLPEENAHADEVAQADAPASHSGLDLHLAVSDSGRFALYRAPFLILGGAGSGTIKKKIKPTKGLFFDRPGRLWRVGENEIVVTSERGEPHRLFRTTSPGAPCRGAHPGEYLVPTSQGILRINTATLTLDYLSPRIMQAAAVTTHLKTGNIFVARAGILTRWNGGDHPSTVAGLPRVPKRMLVDIKGRIWISPRQNGPWHRFENGGWVSEHGEILEQDTQGYLWRGTLLGPDDGSLPGPGTETPVSKRASPAPTWSVEPPSAGPPPCPSGEEGLAPRAGIIFFLDKGSHNQKTTPYFRKKDAQKKIHYGVGVTLTWELRIRPKIICYRARRDWLLAIKMRWRNATATRRWLERSKIQSNTQVDKRSKAFAMLEQAYYTELFQLYGGYTKGGIDENYHHHDRLFDDCNTKSPGDR